MFIQNIVIITTGIFHRELSVLTRENCFCLLLTVCYLMLSELLNFVVQSVLYSGAYLSNLPDMTGGPMVFREVDRSVKQVKSYLVPDTKTGINSNNLPKSDKRNLCFLRLFQFELIG